MAVPHLSHWQPLICSPLWLSTRVPHLLRSQSPPHSECDVFPCRPLQPHNSARLIRCPRTFAHPVCLSRIGCPLSFAGSPQSFYLYVLFEVWTGVPPLASIPTITPRPRCRYLLRLLVFLFYAIFCGCGRFCVGGRSIYQASSLSCVNWQILSNSSKVQQKKWYSDHF